MAKHLLRELENLKKEILLVGSMVEDATDKALAALMDHRDDLAREVIENDRVIDDKEVQVEEECLKILALYQPVAADLRFVVAVLKVNNDLERVGDLAGNLAARAVTLAEMDRVGVPQEITTMADEVRSMLRESLDSLIELDVARARRVLHDDQKVDDLHKSIFGILQERMFANAEHIPQLMQLLSVSRYLERIADLATNIAEDVVFMVAGDVVRHQPA